MFNLRENYRKFERNLVIHESWFGKEIPEGGVETKKTPELPENTTPEEAWKRIDQRYGKDIYAAVIKAQVNKMKGETENKDKLISDYIEEYNHFYDREKAAFDSRSEHLEHAYRRAERRIKNETQNSLSSLKAELHQDSRPERVESRKERREFKKELNDLYGHYFDKKELRKDFSYWQAADEFQDKMKSHVLDRLSFMQENGSTPAEIQAYKQEVIKLYEFYAKIDGVSGTISKEDLRVMSQVANPGVNELKFFINVSPEKLDKRLDLMASMNSDEWKKNVDLYGNGILHQVIDDGLEVEFTQKVNQEIGPVYDFRQARAVFKEHLNNISQSGARATREFLTKFNAELFRPTLQHEMNVDPPALERQVRSQLDLLRTGRLVPFLEEDRAVVEFTNGDRETRNRMLSDENKREILYRGIALATQSYPEKFDQLFRSLPAETKDMRHQKRVDQPTHHDQAAQLQALVILGKEAQAIVSQYNNLPENSGKDLAKKMSEVKAPEDLKQVLLGLKFDSPKSGLQRMTSAAERGGFNMKSIILVGVEGMAILAVVSNIAKSMADSQEDNYLDKFTGAVEQALTNPALIVSGALMTGAHMVRRNKALLNYPSLNEAERKRAMYVLDLDTISAKVGKENKDQFLGSEGEWRVLEKLSEEDLAALKKTANDGAKNGEKPKITREMLVDLGVLDPAKDMTIFDTLSKGPKAARTRFLFYEKFFSQKPKPTVTLVKQLMTGKGSISQDPSKK